VGAAFDRFCTPVPLERRKQAAAKAERLALDLPFGTLVGMAAGPAEGPPALLVHGWNAQAQFLAPLMSACARQGLRVYAFDMPAHGQTREANPAKPTSTMVEWVETLIAASAALGVTRWQSVIAHSFGALASCFALGKRPWGGGPAMSSSSLVLIAAASGMPSVVDSYAEQVPCSADDLADIVGGVEGVTRTALDVLSIRTVADALPARTLLIHDPADTLTRLADIRRELEAHPPSAEMLRDGAGHDAILFQLDVGRAAAKFAAG
jgi:pimeloyl-ACP methyl ester carboxylesterase